MTISLVEGPFGATDIEAEPPAPVVVSKDCVVVGLETKVGV